MREIEVALVAWRNAERALEDAAPDSLEYAEARLKSCGSGMPIGHWSPQRRPRRARPIRQMRTQRWRSQCPDGGSTGV